MSYRITNHALRREIRDKVVAAAKKQDLELQEHQIENLVNRRSAQIGEQLAEGQPTVVDWDAEITALKAEMKQDKETVQGIQNSFADRQNAQSSIKEINKK